MDVMRKLYSILHPTPEPATRSQSGALRPANPAQATFAQTLREAAGWAERSSEIQRTDPVLNGPGNGPGIASNGTETAEPAAADLPIAEVHIDVRDTLEELIIAEQDRLETESAVELDEALEIPISVTPDDTVPVIGADGGDETVRAVDERAEPASDPIPTTQRSTTVALPPIGVTWPAVAIHGTGARSSHGVNGTDAAWNAQLVLKHDQYTNPEKYNAILNTEAKLFLDAVERGYVENSPEGLGTLLGYLSKGSIGPDAKPPAIAAYFNQYFASLTSANV